MGSSGASIVLCPAFWMSQLGSSWHLGSSAGISSNEMESPRHRALVPWLRRWAEDNRGIRKGSACGGGRSVRPESHPWSLGLGGGKGNLQETDYPLWARTCSPLLESTMASVHAGGSPFFPEWPECLPVSLSLFCPPTPL